MLDEHSQNFRNALLTRFPHWHNFASLTTDPSGQEFIVFRICRPLENDTVGGMTISTAMKEVTIECGQHWHGHFSDKSLSQPWSDAFAFIDDILNEKHVFVRYQLDNHVLGGGYVDQSSARKMIDCGPQPNSLHSKSNLVPNLFYLWSWQGTFDRTLTM